MLNVIRDKKALARAPAVLPPPASSQALVPREPGHIMEHYREGLARFAEAAESNFWHVEEAVEVRFFCLVLGFQWGHTSAPTRCSPQDSGRLLGCVAAGPDLSLFSLSDFSFPGAEQAENARRQALFDEAALIHNHGKLGYYRVQEELKKAQGMFIPVGARECTHWVYPPRVGPAARQPVRVFCV